MITFVTKYVFKKTKKIFTNTKSKQQVKQSTFNHHLPRNNLNPLYMIFSNCTDIKNNGITNKC